MRLANRVALVTGGGSCIGRAIAERFAREGAPIAVVDRHTDTAQTPVEQITAPGGGVLALTADVACADDVMIMAKQALATFGRGDLLINCAGYSNGDDIRTIDESAWDAQLSVVLKSVCFCAKALLP